MLAGERLADELGAALVAGSYGPEVRACRGEAQRPVRPAADLDRVMVVLAVILPEAHWADLVLAALG
jgi:hypothetical protein